MVDKVDINVDANMINGVPVSCRIWVDLPAIHSELIILAKA